MASASLEASEIRRRGRRRLIGAVAIVLLLVVFVPMLLDSEPRPARNGPALDIPPKDKVPPLAPPASAAVAPTATPLATPGTAAKEAAGSATSTAPATPTAPASSAPASPSTPASSTSTSPSTSSQVASVAPMAPKPEAAPAHTTPGKGTPKLEGFAVQVGAFRDTEKLREAREKLAAAGVPHYTERLEGRQKGLTRLRAGPFPTRAAAEAAMKKASIKGKVVPLHEEH